MSQRNIPLSLKIPFVLTFIFAASALWALEPAETLLVVNPRSYDSLKVANFYAAARNIPPENVFYLDFDDAKMEIPWTDFYDNLFMPISQRARQRGCYAVALCPGFPLSVNLKDVFDESAADKQFNKVLTKTGSVNGLIYLGRLFESASKSGKNDLRLLTRNYYIYPENGYAVNRNESELINRPIKSFDSATAEKHLLCCFLLTPTRGYSVSQGIENLKQSVAADGTFPSGTVYFMANPDIRTRAREAEFFFAKENIDYLSGKKPRIHVKAEIVQTQDNLPQGKTDIIGLSAGTKVFNWEKSRCKILPGAICENFTSYGGVLYKPNTQTPLTVFLNAGAAGSSGTPAEPYALPEKFPSCAIHYKYLSGLSLIEAYYSSVQWAYQLVIVGDPLCKPWAEKSRGGSSFQNPLPPGVVLKMKPRPIFGEEIPLELKEIPEETSNVEICFGNRILAQKERSVNNTVETTIPTVKLGEGSVTLIIRFKNRSGQTNGVYYTRLEIQPVK